MNRLPSISEPTRDPDPMASEGQGPVKASVLFRAVSAPPWPGEARVTQWDVRGLVRSLSPGNLGPPARSPSPLPLSVCASAPLPLPLPP